MMPGENPNYSNENFEGDESGKFQLTHENKTETNPAREGKPPGVLNPDDTRRGIYK